jgi:hypothetical protein
MRRFYTINTPGKFSFGRLLAGLLLMLAALTQAHAARLALVIGNDNYGNLKGQALNNARNDARLMAAMLRSAGFEVVGSARENLSRSEMWRAINQFKERVGPEDEVVFFFAGHGVQIGANQLLLPVDIEADTADQVETDGLRLLEVQDKFRAARFALLIIDACRDNPFPPRPGTRNFGDTRGLSLPAREQLAMGSAIFMAASTGQRALDRVPGEQVPNGLFTHELVQILKTPGLEVISALRQARDIVEDKAKTVNHAQRPALVEEMRGGWTLFPGGRPTAAPRASLSLEDETWGLCRSSATLGPCQAYLDDFSEGRYARLARTRLADLQPRQVISPTPPAESSIQDRPGAVVASPGSLVPAATMPVQTASPPTTIAATPPGLTNTASTTAGKVERQSTFRMQGGVSASGQFSPSLDGATYSGEGRVAWPSGDVYVGAVRNGKRHGQGLLTWANGQSYEGNWVDDTASGKGRLRFVNGDTFEGDVRDGTPHGQGAIKSASGNSYSGGFADGLPDGIGTYLWADGQSYTGPWVAGRATGRATMRFANGNQYEGAVVSGQPEGEGELQYASGDRFKGQFVAGLPSGIGQYRWADGQTYTGPWVEGKARGNGRLVFANGNDYAGDVVDGIPQGQGLMKFASGESYEGQFVNGVPDGKGTYVWKDGARYVGNWRAGQKDGQGAMVWANGDKWEGVYRGNAQTEVGTLTRKTQ